MRYNWLDLQKQADAEFTARLEAVTDWDAPTPDTEWNVRDLVRHVVLEQQWVPPLLRGISAREAKRTLTPLEGDLVAEWRRYSDLAADAWLATPDDAQVQLSSDTVTAKDFLREQVSDVTIHSWDLARATASSEALDELLVEAVWTQFEPQRDTLEASGLFKSPVPVGEDAPLRSRLLALTGRDDRDGLGWSPHR